MSKGDVSFALGPVRPRHVGRINIYILLSLFATTQANNESTADVIKPYVLDALVATRQDEHLCIVNHTTQTHL